MFMKRTMNLLFMGTFGRGMYNLRLAVSGRIFLNWWVFCTYENDEGWCCLARFFMEEDAFEYVIRNIEGFNNDIHYTVVFDE